MLHNISPRVPFPDDNSIDHDQYNLWITGSMNRNQKSMNKLFEALRPQLIARVAGAGNKIVFMLD